MHARARTCVALLPLAVTAAAICILVPLAAATPGRRAHFSDNVQAAQAAGCAWNLGVNVTERFKPGNVERTLKARDASLSKYATFDGTGNNLVNPDYGTINQPYIRQHPPMYGDSTTCSPGGPTRPNARMISRQGLGAVPDYYNDFSASEMLPMWGLFLHTEASGPDKNAESFPINVPAGDPDFDPGSTGTVQIPMTRTTYLTTQIAADVNNMSMYERVHLNGFTPFLDLSGLYGTTEAICNNTMRGDNGLLKYVNYTVLGEAPPTVGGALGFTLPVINLVPHLTVNYILLFREHNRRARQLYAANPTWTSDQIFYEARRWMIAIVQRITMSYYYPILVGVQAPDYPGYDPSVNPAIDLAFMNVAMRYGHSSLNPMIWRLDENGHPIHEGHQLLEEAFADDNYAGLMAVGIEPYIRGFASQPEQAVDGRYAPVVRNSMPMATYPARFDLVATNIQRSGGRDFGIADYNTLRVAYGLSRVSSWAEMTNDTTVATNLAALYGTTMDNIDAYVGAVVEGERTGNAVLGPLSSAIVKENFARIRAGDRHWYENPGEFTADELAEIKTWTKMGNIVTANTKIDVFPDNPFIVAVKDSVLGASVQTASADLSVTVLDGMTKLSWSMGSSSISFKVESNAKGWFGFGFGDNMLPADIYLFHKESSGAWVGQDCYSTNLQIPTPDTDLGGADDMQSFKQTTDTTFLNAFTFTRALSTGDAHDVDIVNADMPMIFAFGDGALQYHGPTDRAHAAVNFYTGKASILNEGTNLYNLNIFHGVTMFTGFAYVYPVGIYIARYWKNGGTWVTYHQALMSLVTSEIIMAAMLALIGGFGDKTKAHPKIGLFTTVLVMTVTWFGKFAGNWDNEWTVKYNAQIRKMHWMCGYSAYILGLVNGFLGVTDISAGTSYEWLRWLYIPAVLMMPLLLAIFHAVYGSRASQKLESDEAKGPTSSSSLPSFTWNNIHERVETGSKWIVIRSVIYDAGLFMDRHPGGKQILAGAVGLDATDLFYGPPLATKAAKGDKKRPTAHVAKLAGFPIIHRHSRLAESLLASLAVGRLTGHKAMDFQPNLDEESNTGSFDRKGSFSERPSGFNPPFARDPTQPPVSPLSPQEFRTFTLVSSEIVSGPGCTRPTRLFKFALPSPNDKVYTFPGQSVLMQFITAEGEVVTRPYTPFKVINTKTIDFYIKVNVGVMTAHLVECKAIRMRGPSLHTDAMNVADKNGCWDNIGMIAGGSGLTPLLMTIDYHFRYASRDPATGRPTTIIHLLNINRTNRDMFAQEELEQAAKSFMGNLKITNLVHSVVDNDKYQGEVGTISPDVIAKALPAPRVHGTASGMFGTSSGVFGTSSGVFGTGSGASGGQLGRMNMLGNSTLRRSIAKRSSVGAGSKSRMLDGEISNESRAFLGDDFVEETMSKSGSGVGSGVGGLGTASRSEKDSMVIMICG
ncbi:hypothetical protein HDU87_008842 [Geranomyces variabilis]|uniref:Cytochrome b5 heme-binding domain-containing protein n=1 Tax=Geranomyces variabilis TaxID=109894 RepID=A0AAD5TCE1_9FUNG|nr:hypothetical protein HDU87_008842 [Geranomyces variabilis]